MEPLPIPGVPFPTEWAVQPVSASVDGTTLRIEAPADTDLFTDPKHGILKANPPRLMCQPTDDLFSLSTHVAVTFASTFDAGVIVLWVDDDYWAKLCFEYSPQGEPMIVTVVNNGISDDCNSVALTRRDIYLRATRLENTFAFHYSEDGVYWRMVRYFTLLRRTPLQVGLSSQSPTGKGCTATFDEIRYSTNVVTDFRSGK